MKKFRILLLVVLIPALFQVSCKKDETPPAPVYRQPVAASMGDVVTVPDGLTALSDGGDYNATMAVIYMEFANAISGFGGLFAVPDNADLQTKKGGPAVYYWSYGGYSYWMTYSESADKYTWTYDYEFPGVSRFTYISAEEDKAGKTGSWTIYNPDAPQSYIWTYDWSINSSNNFTASLQWADDMGAVSKFDVVSNANHSGSFKYYELTVLSAEILWNADGSGTYWMSDGGAGVSGSWTAK